MADKELKLSYHNEGIIENERVSVCWSLNYFQVP